jgi:hypothetical protein
MMSNNSKIITFEKTLKNRINRKLNKLFKKLDKNELNFIDLNDEIKFLNQLYFLNNSIEDLNSNLDNMNEIITNLEKKEKIKIDFKEKVSDDNWNKEIVGKLSRLVFL